MATDWNNCLVTFYVHCYIHVCMCLCVLECGGFGKNPHSLQSKWWLRRILHAWAANPLPPRNEVDPCDMKQYQFRAAKLTFGIILKQMIMWYCSNPRKWSLWPSFLQHRTWNCGRMLQNECLFTSVTGMYQPSLGTRKSWAFLLEKSFLQILISQFDST